MTFIARLGFSLWRCMCLSVARVCERMGDVRYATLIRCLAVVAASACASSGAQAQEARSEHVVVRFSAPSPASPKRAIPGSVARYGSIAASGDDLFLVGNDVRLFNQVVRNTPLVAWMVARKDLGRPVGSFTFAYPRGLSSRDGALWVLWTEPAAAPEANSVGFTWPGSTLTSVWAAQARPGRGWSAATRLFESRGDLLWPSTPANYVFADTNGGGGVVTAELAGVAPTGVLFHLEKGVWKTRRLPGTMLSVSIASKDGTNMIGVYLPAIAIRGDEKGGLYVIYSRDGGAQWTKPALLQAGGGAKVGFYAVFVGVDGSPHAVWQQEANGASSLVHAQMRADSTWGVRDTLGLGRQVWSASAVMDVCGRVHVFYEDPRNDPAGGNIEHVLYNGRWGEPQHLFKDLSTTEARAAARKSGEVVVTFLAQDRGAPANAPLRSMISSTVTCRKAPAK